MIRKNEKAPLTGTNEADGKSLATALNPEPEDKSSGKQESDKSFRDRMSDRVLEKLGVHESDILHKTLNKFKNMVRQNHNSYHLTGVKKLSWRKCGGLFCEVNRHDIEESELLLYGSVQDD